MGAAGGGRQPPPGGVLGLPRAPGPQRPSARRPLALELLELELDIRRALRYMLCIKHSLIYQSTGTSQPGCNSSNTPAPCPGLKRMSGGQSFEVGTDTQYYAAQSSLVLHTWARPRIQPTSWRWCYWCVRICGAMLAGNRSSSGFYWYNVRSAAYGMHARCCVQLHGLAAQAALHAARCTPPLCPAPHPQPAHMTVFQVSGAGNRLS